MPWNDPHKVLSTHTLNLLHVWQIQKYLINYGIGKEAHEAEYGDTAHRFNYAVFLACLGLFSDVVKHRCTYMFCGAWALGRFHSIKLVQHLSTLTHAQMHDQETGGHFRKLLKEMEPCVQTTYHEGLKLWGVLIQLGVGLVASAFLSDSNGLMRLAAPASMVVMTVYMIFSKQLQRLYGWPQLDGFDSMENNENDLNTAADDLILNRVMASTMGVAPKYIDAYNAKYGAWLGGRTTAWYFVNHSKWASYWSWDVFIWAAVAASPWLYDHGVTVGEFIATWTLLKKYGSNITELVNRIECLRYGIAKLDDLSECLNKSQKEKTMLHSQRAKHDIERQAMFARLLATADLQDIDGYIYLHDVTYERAASYPSLTWVPCPSGEAAVRAPDFAIKSCTHKLKIGPGLIYGVAHKHECTCDALMRLLAGYVLPQGGRIDFPPGVSSMLVSNRPSSVNGTLRENLRFGCGEPEESGMDDDEMWRICAALGMSEDLVVARGMSAKLAADGATQEELHLAEASINLSKPDVAVIYLAQHLFCKPDVLVVNEPSCITPMSLRVLRAYVNGELFSNHVSGGTVRTTVIVHLTLAEHGDKPKCVAPRAALFYCLPIVISTTGKPMKKRASLARYAEYVDKMLEFSTALPTVIQERDPASPVLAVHDVHTEA